MSVPLTALPRKEAPLSDYKIQQVFQLSFPAFEQSAAFLPDNQRKAAYDIMKCKTASLGFSASACQDCGYTRIHYNSCRNRNCPNCQAVARELWVDARSAEVIDTPYFHVVFTLPHQLNPLLLSNQRSLYALLHKCCAQTLLELSSSPKYLGATPGIIQVLHTWNQELGYHVHMHCIVSGGGLTRDRKFRKSSSHFFIPVHVLRDKFKGKFLAMLHSLYQGGKLSFPSSCASLMNPGEWSSFKDHLYKIDWCPYIKETFNGLGNAIEYLGKYTHKIAISNSRIISVSDTEVSFSARGIKPGAPRRTITLTHREFIRRFLLHVLPCGFQKIRYYGFLNNRSKAKNLDLIFKLQGRQQFRSKYTGLSMQELLLQIWNINVCVCPMCGGHIRPAGKVLARPG